MFIYEFFKTGAIITYGGSPYQIPVSHGLGTFSEPHCKEGSTYCFFGVNGSGSMIQYRLDTAVPGYEIITYPIGVYQKTCVVDRQSTIVVSGYVNSVYAISDYTQISNNVIKTSLPSGVHTGVS